MNASKTKVMVFEREENKTVGKVDEIIYLGCIFSKDGRYDRDIEQRVNAAGNRVSGIACHY